MSADFRTRLAKLNKGTIKEALSYIDFSYKKGSDLPHEYERAMVYRGMEEFLDRMDDAVRKKTAKAYGAKGTDKPEIMEVIQEVEVKHLFDKLDEELIKQCCASLSIAKEATTRSERAAELKDEVTLIGAEALLKGLTFVIINKHCQDLGLKVEGNKEKRATALHDHIFDLISEDEEKAETGGKGDDEEVLNRSTDKKRKADELEEDDDDDDKAKHKSKKQKTEDKEKEKEKEKKRKEKEKEKKEKERKAKEKKEKEEKARKEKARREREKEREKKERDRRRSSSSSKRRDDSDSDSSSSSSSDSDSESSSSEDERRSSSRGRGRPKKGSRSSSSRSRSSKSKSKSRSSSSKKEKVPFKSPNISTIVKGKYSATDLHDKFYLGDLKEYCKQNDLRITHLKKAHIIRTIIDFIDKGERPQDKKKKKGKKKKAAAKKKTSDKQSGDELSSSSGSSSPASPSSRKRKDAPSPSPARSNKKSRTEDSGSSGDEKSKSK